MDRFVKLAMIEILESGDYRLLPTRGEEDREALNLLIASGAVADVPTFVRTAIGDGILEKLRGKNDQRGSE